MVRSSPTSQWKGLAAAGMALSATNAALLAARGVTGPRAVFEGPRGWFSVVGKKAKVNWNDRQLTAIRHVSLKKYNAEVHTQTALDALLELAQAHHVRPEQVVGIDFETVLTTYDIVGGGSYGNRKVVESKEQADHSLPYLAAVAVIDGEVGPEQFAPDRIKRADVQQLLQKVTARPKSRLRGPRRLVERLDPYTRVYPEQMPVNVTVRLKNGRRLSLEKRSYNGFWDDPMSWDAVIAKFDRLAAASTTAGQRERVVEIVRNLENHDVADLTQVLRLEKKADSTAAAKSQSSADKPRRKPAEAKADGAKPSSGRRRLLRRPRTGAAAAKS